MEHITVTKGEARYGRFVREQDVKQVDAGTKANKGGDWINRMMRKHGVADKDTAEGRAAYVTGEHSPEQT